jgi:hypothetical protein
MTWLDLLTLLPFGIYGARWVLYPPLDGWSWSRAANAVLFLIASCFFFERYFPDLLRPGTGPWVTLSLYWCVARFLATAQFRDPTGIGKFRNASATKLRYLVDLALICGLALNYFGREFWAESFLLATLITTTVWRLFRSDWRKIFKRSRRTSLLFFFAQNAASFALAYHYFRPIEYLPHAAVLALLVTGAIRLELHLSARRRGENSAKELQKRIAGFSTGIEKIEAFVTAIDETFFPARVSVVSVRGEYGLLLASAGTDALESDDAMKPRRLGPLLRRVIREQHILYAPVAEELGSELRKEGLKHSAIALPIVRGEDVIAAVTYMAEEGERIAPSNALAIERLVEALSTELLTAMDQCHAELERDQLRAIAKIRAAMETESLDAWGRLPVLHIKEERVTVMMRAMRNNAALQALAESPRLSEVYETWLMELDSLWQRICGVFEFLPVPSDTNDFIAYAPREFTSPLLRHLGVEQSAAIMGHLLRTHVHALATHANFAVLSVPPPRIAVARCHVHMHTQHQLGSRQLSIHSPEIFYLQMLLNASVPGQVLIDTHDKALLKVLEDKELFQTSPSIRHASEIRVLTGLRADRKDIRRLDLAILDSTRKDRVA